MQIIMLNGEKSPKFNSDFSTATALNYSQIGLTKYGFWLHITRRMTQVLRWMLN